MKTTSSTVFTFYRDTELNISRVHPVGGPIGGGTVLHIYLADERLLIDLGGEEYGPACRFSYAKAYHGEARPRHHTVVVSAALTSCEGVRTCGAGWRAMSCVAPPFTGPLINGSADVFVEVSINRQDFTASESTYRYYDPDAWRMVAFTPLGGPLIGNTTLHIQSTWLTSLGDFRCRFRQRAFFEDANASVTSPTHSTCLSPPHWEPHSGVQRVEIELTLNGQDFMGLGTHTGIYTYYPLDSAVGLSIQGLTPAGGPSNGGTLIQVTGTGFARYGRLMCQFEGEASGPKLVVAASLSSSALLTCVSPALNQAVLPFEPYAVSVTVNGHLNAFTHADSHFVYYDSASTVRLSHMYPQGGPIAGGTMVSIWGSGFRDLGHGAGLMCAFDEVSVAATRQHRHVEWLKCMAPPTLSYVAEQGSCPPPGSGLHPTVHVRVTLNGDTSAMSPALTVDSLLYSYFKA